MINRLTKGTAVRLTTWIRQTAIAAILFWLLPFAMSCSRSGGGIDGTDESKDHTPPFAVTDLTVIDMSPSTVSLRWTAPGDDGDSGRASAYDLRYSGTAITEQFWDSATTLPGMPGPSAAHTLDSALLTGLLADSTYYFAIRTADEAGNWSPLSNIASVICVENVVVSFSDTALDRVIRFHIAKPDGDIHQLDLLDMTEINAWGQRIEDLGGLEYCTNLYALRLFNNGISNLTPLSGLGGLRVLDLGLNGLADSSISPLAALTELDTLRLQSNNLIDLTALAGMEHLSYLDLSYNKIWMLTPLTGKTSIRELSLSGNQIVFVNALYGLTGLDKLRLAENQINDLLPLAYNTGLGTGDSVWLNANPLGAATTDSLIGVLQARGVTLIR